MLDWRVEAALAGGPIAAQGTAKDLSGPVRIACDVPEAVLRRVTAEMDLAVEPDERIFMNGYQTWTCCPELGPEDRLRGLNGLPGSLVRKNGFDRYGDYHFVQYPCRPGLSHGFSWCYFRRGDRYRLIASLDEAPGYTIFRYDARRGLLTLERDCAGVRHGGGQLHVFDLYFAEGGEDEVFDGWFDALGLERPSAPAFAGYSSWYDRYEDIDQASVRQALAGCGTVLEKGDLFQIDDGWEPAVGDWLEPDGAKFPDGMKAMADQIHAAGFQAGLWLAPFVCRKGSRLMEEHPDWLLQVEGEPWLCGSNWGGFYALDIDRPEVLDYLRQVFQRVLHQWGFDLVKLDFLYGAAPFGTGRESRAGRMIRAMDFLRQVCAGKRILGCGVPLMPAFGRVDYCRISCDVSLDWDGGRLMRMAHRERVSTRQALCNTLVRRQLDGRAFRNDPDVFFLRDENIRLTGEQKLLLAKVNALLGGVYMTSDDPSRYDGEKRELYRALRSLTGAEDVRVEPDRRRIRWRLDGKEQTLELPETRFGR